MFLLISVLYLVYQNEVTITIVCIKVTFFKIFFNPIEFQDSLLQSILNEEFN